MEIPLWSVPAKNIHHFAHQKVQHKYLEHLKNFQVDSYQKTDFLIREQQLQKYIDKEIAALPRKMRLIFELSRKEHLTHTEIALRLKISADNVSTQISNAIRILRSKLTSFIFISQVAASLQVSSHDNQQDTIHSEQPFLVITKHPSRK